MTFHCVSITFNEISVPPRLTMRMWEAKAVVVGLLYRLRHVLCDLKHDGFQELGYLRELIQQLLFASFLALCPSSASNNVCITLCIYTLNHLLNSIIHSQWPLYASDRD